MHSSYIGGLMGNPMSAAEDPIFWSYHAFIDLLWWQWQQQSEHKVDSCLDCKLCGLNWTVQRVVNSEKQLNVTYDFVPPPTPPAALVATNAPAPLASVDMALGGKVDHAERRTSLVTIPAKPVKSAKAVIQDVRIASPVTFQVNVFFYPESEAGTFDPKNRAMRDRSTVFVGTVWQKHHGLKKGDRLTQSFQVDLAPFLNPLIAQHKGETWLLDARTYVDPKSGEHMHGVAADPAEIRSILQLGGISVSLE
jgi:tyrosinase